MSEFRMPSLGADMADGILVEWKVQPGLHIRRGDVIADVETDKGVVEVEIFEDGVIDQLIVQPGTKVPVGTVLAMIRTNGAPAAPTVEPLAPPFVGEPRTPAAPAVLPVAPAAQARIRVSPVARKLAETLGVDLRTVPGSGPHGAIERADIERAAAQARIRVSPVARKLAEALGVDLRTVSGSGPHGVIERADIERAAASAHAKAVPAPAVVPAPAAERPAAADFQAAMRRAIAAAMARSNREIPHYYLETRIDMSRALRWLEAENQKRSIKDRLLPAVLLLKAVARALGDVPDLNGYWLDDRHQPQEAIHIGFAIALRQGGLVTPAIHNVDHKRLDELMAALRDLITRVRAGRLRSSELTDATITVTNLGDMGVATVYGVIYPPQVALVGFGKIIDQPWAEHGMLGVRPVLTATLAGDHRATDGRRGAQFLDALNRYLQEADTL
jgi:pyruvate dehydrogenase E2 component (dihydrolipoamide acetyltransferase)